MLEISQRSIDNRFAEIESKLLSSLPFFGDANIIKLASSFRSLLVARKKHDDNLFTKTEKYINQIMKSESTHSLLYEYENERLDFNERFEKIEKRLEILEPKKKLRREKKEKHVDVDTQLRLSDEFVKKLKELTDGVNKYPRDAKKQYNESKRKWKISLLVCSEMEKINVNKNQMIETLMCISDLFREKSAWRGIIDFSSKLFKVFPEDLAKKAPYTTIVQLKNIEDDKLRKETESEEIKSSKDSIIKKKAKNTQT